MKGVTMQERVNGPAFCAEIDLATRITGLFESRREQEIVSLTWFLYVGDVMMPSMLEM